ncbi:hypothetical protein HPB49_012889 [Dermacentor silvarum]|uniref:Uncharacterized protein n=1 Tax=Dermacentor silvarum TaxID=543639 RepID=A0ACB8CL05_DERSI|nr:hypothetical protein HPB49_012889 [Dermacentor silvarum]
MDSSCETPLRENCFMFNAPDGDISVDDLIDAIELTAGDDSVLALQHMGGAKFLVCTRTAAQATKLMVAEGFRVNHVRVPVEAVGPPVTFVNVYRLPVYVFNEVVAAALQPYGNVKSVAYTKVLNRQNKLNGVRVVRVEMCRPVPNFMTMQGHRVMCEYRGMRRVCARCGDGNHMATACTSPYCKRCGVFGHEAESCDEECRKCGGRHATKTCFRGKAYAKSNAGTVWQHTPPEQAPARSARTDAEFPPLETNAASGMQVLKPRGPNLPRKKTSYWDGESAGDSTQSMDSKPNETEETSTNETPATPISDSEGGPTESPPTTDMTSHQTTDEKNSPNNNNAEKVDANREASQGMPQSADQVQAPSNALKKDAQRATHRQSGHRDGSLFSDTSSNSTAAGSQRQPKGQQRNYHYKAPLKPTREAKHRRRNPTRIKAEDQQATTQVTVATNHKTPGFQKLQLHSYRIFDATDQGHNGDPNPKRQAAEATRTAAKRRRPKKHAWTPRPTRNTLQLKMSMNVCGYRFSAFWLRSSVKPTFSRREQRPGAARSVVVARATSSHPAPPGWRSENPPPKAHCFTFNAPTGSSADEIIDAIEETVGPGGLETLQHQGGVKFIAAVASAAAAVKLSSRGSFVLNGTWVPVAQVGPRVLYISAFRVPPYVGDATLAAALSTYGKVLAIQESQFKGRPTVGTGVRVIRMEMAKPGQTSCPFKATASCLTTEEFARSYAAAAASANIPASIEDSDGQRDQDEVQTPLEGPRHSELSETASRSESSDSSENEDFPPLPSTERSTTEVSASETDSSKTTSPSQHETDAADSATRESVAVNEPTDKPRPSVYRRLHPQPEQMPSPGIGRETGLAQARGYQVPRTTDASLMNAVDERLWLSLLGLLAKITAPGPRKVFRRVICVCLGSRPQDEDPQGTLKIIPDQLCTLLAPLAEPWEPSDLGRPATKPVISFPFQAPRSAPSAGPQSNQSVKSVSAIGRAWMGPAGRGS